ncbi:MAG TPA: hypothetical protein VK173_10315, partial [Lacibacter sp.]|nr:hypothetical protein [Lacibacter sp.]
MATNREAAIEMNKEEFRQMAYKLIDSITEFIGNIEQRPVTTGETPEQIQNILGTASLPEHGTSGPALLEKATELMMNHSL